MWRPKLRRQGRHLTRAGLEYATTERFRSRRPPRGAGGHPSQREIARAMDTIPADLGWEWAKERVVPVLERPGADPMPDDPYLAAVADSGVPYGFGIDLGAIFARVTRGLADRWERDAAAVRDVALANLRRRLFDEDPGFENPSHADGALLVRALQTPQGFASSAILVPDALKRIFGDADQVFTAPCRPLLLAFPIDTPSEAIDALTEEAERMDPNPLYLDPFRLVAGRLTWDGIVPAVGARA